MRDEAPRNMPKVRASAIVRISLGCALLIGSALVLPFALDYWTAWEARRALERDFIAASESDQQLIVVSLLKSEMRAPLLCGPVRPCPDEPIYFDRRSAVLFSLDDPEPQDPYEPRLVQRQEYPFHTWENPEPLPLQQLLDRLVQTRIEHADPGLPGLIYVHQSNDLPKLGLHGICTPRSNPRLLRISAAAVQQSQGLALVLVSRTFCDGSTGSIVVRLKRAGAEWLVVERR